MSKIGRGVRKTMYWIAGMCALASGIILLYSIKAGKGALTEDTSAASISIEYQDIEDKIAKIKGSDFWDKAEQYLKEFVGDKAKDVIDDIKGGNGIKEASWQDIEWDDNAEYYREFKKVVDYLNEQAKKQASASGNNAASGNNR